VTETLLVVLHGEVVGELERATPHSEPIFRYSTAYLASGTVPLSLRLPPRAEAYPARLVTPYIEGLLPENEATRNDWASRLRLANSDAFSLLSRMGWDCPGAVQFTPPDKINTMRARGSMLRPVSERKIGDRLRALRTDEASWALPDEHWSLAGQQSKFALVSRDGRWYRATGAAATTHILKPGIGRLRHQALVEHATMRAAALAGVEVVNSDYREFDGEPAIVIERFDRLNADGEVIRLHQEDFCQAVGRMPAFKYEAPRGPGLKDMNRVIRSASADVRRDAERLLDFVAINYVAGAPDGHSKNIALLLLPDQVRVAPLYDLSSAFPYKPSRGTLEVAVSIGGRRKLGEVQPRHWAEAARVLGLPPRYVHDRVYDLADRFPAAFTSALEAIGTDAAHEVRERARERLARHCDRLRAQLDSGAAATAFRGTADSPG